MQQDQPASAAWSGFDPSILASIEWIDWIAIVLLVAFATLGLFKGLIWQVSRVLTLLLSWAASGLLGPIGAGWLRGAFDPETSPPDLPLFLAYAVAFVLVLVGLSIVAMLLQKLIEGTSLSAANRIGGALVGLATGAVLTITLLAGVHMLIPGSSVAEAADRSRSMAASQRTLRLLGDALPEEVQRAMGVTEAVAPGDELRGKGEAPPEPKGAAAPEPEAAPPQQKDDGRRRR